jgi:hypothetical protein
MLIWHSGWYSSLRAMVWTLSFYLHVENTTFELKTIWNMQKFWNVELSVSCNKIYFFLLCLSTRINLLLKGSISNYAGFCLILCYWLLKYLLQSHVAFTIYLCLFHFVLCAMPFIIFLPCPFCHVWDASEAGFAIPTNSYDLPRSTTSQITGHYIWDFSWSPQWIQANSRTVN